MASSDGGAATPEFAAAAAPKKPAATTARRAAPVDVHSAVGAWVASQKALLALERDAERAEVADALAGCSPAEAQGRGLSLLNLAVLETSTALYGQ